MDYQIVATLGPSSGTADTWENMLAAGVTAFRLNTSHLSLLQLEDWLDRLAPFLTALEFVPPLVLDLQGSKWRVGNFASFELVDGQAVEFIYAASTDRPNILPVPHQDFFKAAPLSSKEIVLNDARVRLWVETVGQDSIKARIVQGGLISPHKGLTFTSSIFRQENMSEKDQAIFEMTRSLSFIRYAVSYIKDAAEMGKYRSVIGHAAYLIAKLERGPAVDEAIQIADKADELWLCRGDLGAELGIKDMAEKVYRFADTLRETRVPVLMAGQVLEHMTTQITPTRSEVCYLYDALERGYHGFVLSDETATGQFPVEACRAAALFRTKAWRPNPSRP
jgi:pyruvate kinase